MEGGDLDLGTGGVCEADDDDLSELDFVEVGSGLTV